MGCRVWCLGLPGLGFVGLRAILYALGFRVGVDQGFKSQGLGLLGLGLGFLIGCKLDTAPTQ